MKYRAWSALPLLLAACTVNNPFYVGNGGDGGGINFDGGSGKDSSPGHPDLSSTSPDMTAMCVDGQHHCAPGTPPTSLSCAGGMLAPDRICPGGSDCMSGYCAPPPQNQMGAGQPCDSNSQPRENDCTQFTIDLSCQPFIDPTDKSVSWVCDKHVGMGLPGDPCTSGKTCRTGFCGSNGTCFRGCTDISDCPNNGKALKCSPVSIIVEGVMITANSCIPLV